MKMKKLLACLLAAALTGSLAVRYVYDQAADGTNLLMGAENPALYDKLGISDLTYDDFECVFLIGGETTGVVVGKDSPYNSLTEIVDAAKGGAEVTLATAGTGGLPWGPFYGVFVKQGTDPEVVRILADAFSKAL